MATLTGTEFNLKFQDHIAVRVQALNHAGAGPWSRENTTGVQIRGKPGKMSPPVRGQSADNQAISIEWNKLTTAEEHGNSAIL